MKVYIVRELDGKEPPRAYFDKSKALADLEQRIRDDQERTIQKPETESGSYEYIVAPRSYSLSEYEVIE